MAVNLTVPGHAMGSERFRKAIEAQRNQRVGPVKIGRPRKFPKVWCSFYAYNDKLFYQSGIYF